MIRWIAWIMSGAWIFILLQLSYGEGKKLQEAEIPEEIFSFPLFADTSHLWKKLRAYNYIGWAICFWREEKRGAFLDLGLLNAMAVLTDENLAKPALNLWRVETFRDLFLISAFFPAAGLLSPALLVLFLCLFVLRLWSSSYLLKHKSRALRRQVIQDMPAVLTDLLLSMQAGSLADQAWRAVAQGGQGPLHREMRRVMETADAGLPLEKAFRSFGRKFHIENLDQLGLLYAQNLRLGGCELTRGLDRIRHAEIENQKRSLKIEADLASQQMIFPGILVFFTIILLIIVPLLGHAFAI